MNPTQTQSYGHLPIVWATIWLTSLYGPSTWSLVHVAGGIALFILSIPLAWLSGMFSHTDRGSTSELIAYLLLMIPNCFLIGYSLSGAISLVGGMSKPMKGFTKGFLGAVLAFGVANLISYSVRSDFPGAADGIRRVGFPFLVSEEGGFAYRYHFNHAALWANIAIAAFLGGILGAYLRRRAR